MSGGMLAGRRRIATVFLAFAYFLSTLVRAITATLSPALTAEFELEACDLPAVRLMTWGLSLAMVMFAIVLIADHAAGMDLSIRAGLDTVESFRAALSVLLGCCVMSYLYFLWAPPHNRSVVLPAA